MSTPWALNLFSPYGRMDQVDSILDSNTDFHSHTSLLSYWLVGTEASNDVQFAQGWMRLFMLILSQPLGAKMSLGVFTTHLAHFSTHTSLRSDWWARRRETVGSVVSGGRWALDLVGTHVRAGGSSSSSSSSCLAPRPSGGAAPALW